LFYDRYFAPRLIVDLQISVYLYLSPPPNPRAAAHAAAQAAMQQPSLYPPMMGMHAIQQAVRPMMQTGPIMAGGYGTLPVAGGGGGMGVAAMGGNTISLDCPPSLVSQRRRSFSPPD
jgi:hypothetical protein